MIRRIAEAIVLMVGVTTLSDTTLTVLGVKDRIDVEQEGYANTMVITAIDTNPTLAQRLPNELAEVYR